VPKRKTFQEIKEYIEERGFKLRSSSYNNSKEHLLLECPEGHTYPVSWNNFHKGSGCPYCNGRIVTYEYVKNYIESVGFKLNSKEYKTNTHKLSITCDKGHLCSITWNDFQQGVRCSKCLHKVYTDADIVKEVECQGFSLLDISKKNNCRIVSIKCSAGHTTEKSWENFKKFPKCSLCEGKFKSEEFIIDYAKNLGYEYIPLSHSGNSITVRCKEGHLFNTSIYNLKVRKSCPVCIKYKSSKEFIESLLIPLNYSLLEIYKGSVIRIRCPKGHDYTVAFSAFRRGNRCPYCYGNILTLEDVRNMYAKEDYTFLSDSYANSKTLHNIKCPAGHVYKGRTNDFQQGHKCPKCNSNFSKAERTLSESLRNLLPKSLKMVLNDRSVIGPKELDIYFPEEKVAIEFCGLYWHSEDMLNKNRSFKDGWNGKNNHRKKLELCREKDIRLITIFSDEFRDHPDICLSRIAQALNQQQNRIYARKCNLKQITSKEANDFFKGNHLQGSTKNKVAFGLYYEDDLVEVVSLGSLTRSHVANKTIELKRLASKKNTHVVGGPSKLFAACKSWAVDNGYTVIRSYCDLRWGTGNLYKVLGFNIVNETSYSPHYVNKKDNRVRNITLRKTPEERLTGKTEWELRQAQGYLRIYDCGHQTWDYSLYN
jgi:hypothetical protein